MQSTHTHRSRAHAHTMPIRNTQARSRTTWRRCYFSKSATDPVKSKVVKAGREGLSEICATEKQKEEMRKVLSSEKERRDIEGMQIWTGSGSANDDLIAETSYFVFLFH